MPTNISEEVTKDEFCHVLQKILESISSHKIVVVMSANAMLGPEARNLHIRPYITDTALTETTSNDNGEQLFKLCHSTGYCIADTYFPQKLIYHWMLYSPD